MMSRSGSVRLRSSLAGKMDQSDSGGGGSITSAPLSTAAAVISNSIAEGKASRRRAGNNNNNSSGNNNGHLLHNGNGAIHPLTTTTSTRSQSRTRGGGGMDVDLDDSNGNTSISLQQQDLLSEKTTMNTSVFSNTANIAVSVTNSTNNNSNNDTAMEVDPDGSSSTSSSSDSSDSSDSEDSSEMDEVSCEKKRLEFQEDLADLEKQFVYLRELLYKERMTQVELKLEEVRSGKAKEYLNPLEELQENMRIRIEVAGRLKEFRLINMQNKFEAEELAAFQNFESEKVMLFDAIKCDLEDKIHRLEEDRNNDFTSELWLETALKRKNKKSVDIFGEKRKKPVTVTGPYMVYMLNDVDIVEDWTIIKKAMAAPKRKYVEMVF